MNRTLNTETVMNEPREILHKITGCFFRPVFPFFFKGPKIIKIIIPNPSLRQGAKLDQEYLRLLQKAANHPDDLQSYVIDFVAEALKGSSMKITRRWIKKKLDEEALAQFYEFLVQPRKQRIEEWLKNSIALLNAQNTLGKLQNGK